MCHFCEFAGLGAGGFPHFAAAPPSFSGSAPAAAGNAKSVPSAAETPFPEGVGVKGRRTLIKGGTILSMDERVGNHAVGDVLIDGSTIAEVAASIDAQDAAIIDASGHIVMPGFIDAHHRQFETALRSFLADGILINDGRPGSARRLLRGNSSEPVEVLPAAGRLRRRAVRRRFADRRRRHRGDGHFADPPFAGTFRRGDRGASRRGPPRGVRLFRGLG